MFFLPCIYLSPVYYLYLRRWSPFRSPATHKPTKERCAAPPAKRRYHHLVCGIDSRILPNNRTESYKTLQNEHANDFPMCPGACVNFQARNRTLPVAASAPPLQGLWTLALGRGTQATTGQYCFSCHEHKESSRHSHTRKSFELSKRWRPLRMAADAFLCTRS